MFIETLKKKNAHFLSHTYDEKYSSQSLETRQFLIYLSKSQKLIYKRHTTSFNGSYLTLDAFIKFREMWNQFAKILPYTNQQFQSWENTNITQFKGGRKH